MKHFIGIILFICGGLMLSWEIGPLWSGILLLFVGMLVLILKRRENGGWLEFEMDGKLNLFGFNVGSENDYDIGYDIDVD